MNRLNRSIALLLLLCSFLGLNGSYVLADHNPCESSTCDILVHTEEVTCEEQISPLVSSNGRIIRPGYTEVYTRKCFPRKYAGSEGIWLTTSRSKPFDCKDNEIMKVYEEVKYEPLVNQDPRSDEFQYFRREYTTHSYAPFSWDAKVCKDGRSIVRHEGSCLLEAVSETLFYEAELLFNEVHRTHFWHVEGTTCYIDSVKAEAQMCETNSQDVKTYMLRLIRKLGVMRQQEDNCYLVSEEE